MENKIESLALVFAVLLLETLREVGYGLPLSVLLAAGGFTLLAVFVGVVRGLAKPAFPPAPTEGEKAKVLKGIPLRQDWEAKPPTIH